MARNSRGLGTTSYQLFNDETTKTEDKLRIKWFEQNRQHLVENLQDEKLIRKAQTIRENYEKDRLKKKKEEDDKVRTSGNVYLRFIIIDALHFFFTDSRLGIASGLETTETGWIS